MIRVLLVDDSPTVRRVLREALATAAGIEVVGEAADPYEAREKIFALSPDVMTLDLEMPRMDGLSFLAQLMAHRPMRVVVISSLTQRGSDEAVRALELGAVDVLCKPRAGLAVAEFGAILARSIHAAGSATLRRSGARTPLPIRREPLQLAPGASDRLLAIGASTGGTVAISEVMRRLPATMPGIVIVQHMPPLFTASFAKRLNEICELDVAEAKGSEILEPGRAFVAPGGMHLVVQRSGAGRYRLDLRNGPPVHYQRPSVDVTFNSVAEAAGAKAIGVLLTGMGSDGAQGLLAMRQAGAETIAQNESSCVVYGMPRAAVECGAAKQVLPLDLIHRQLIALFSS